METKIRTIRSSKKHGTKRIRRSKKIRRRKTKINRRRKRKINQRKRKFIKKILWKRLSTFINFIRQKQKL